MKFFFFVLSLTSFLVIEVYSSSIETLYQDKYWSYLLHAKNGVSEIDDSYFFLSKNGKHNLKEELVANIKELKENNNSFYCTFPARREWILSKIPSLQNSIKKQSCPQLDTYLKNVYGDSVTLIFPTTHINSPASMFGHTLLRIDRENESDLLAMGVNYAAYTKESNGFFFAFKGLFGFYSGKYATIPYYEKIKEYNALENRDIWEYKLNLTKEEMMRLILHLYEVKDSASDYFFFDENCSYHIVWLLQIARPSVSLIDRFNYIVPPLLTIRDAYDAGMVKSSKFRYSKMRLLHHLIYDKLKDKQSALAFEKSNYLPSFLENYSKEQQAIILDIAINRLQYERSQDHINKKNYLSLFLKLLKLRSKVKVISNYEVKKPTDPLKGHYLTRVGALGTLKGSFIGSMRLGYHDIFDIDDGFRAGAYIDFVNFDFEIDKKRKFNFEKLDFISIASYAPIDEYFQPLSWEVNLGVKSWVNDKLYSYLDLGAGYSYAKSNLILYTTLKPSLALGEKSYFGLGGRVGGIYSYAKNTKIGASLTKTYFDTGLEEKKSEAFFIFKLHKRVNFISKYEYNSLFKEKISFGLNYYLNI